MAGLVVLTNSNNLLVASGLSAPLWAPYISPTLLRLLPLISSTASLQWAMDEYMFHKSWLLPSIRAEADNIFPKYFKEWVQKGQRVLFTSFSWSVGVGLTNAWQLRHSGYWYLAGAVLAAGHMAYGGRAMVVLDKIRREEPKGKAIVTLRELLSLHIVRLLTTDLPSFICFAIAATQALVLRETSTISH